MRAVVFACVPPPDKDSLVDAERVQRLLQLRHLVERVAEQALRHAQITQLLH